MPLTDAQLRVEQQKARCLAMKSAMEMIESQPGLLCGSCAQWQDKYSQDTRRLYQEVGHLRGAVQKMVDKLASHVPGDSLRTFLKELDLDDRLFTIHAGGDFYRKVEPEPTEPQESLEDVIAERDLAKMKLAAVGRELSELRREKEALDKQRKESEEQNVRQKNELEELRQLQLQEEVISADDARRSLFDSPLEKVPLEALETKIFAPPLAALKVPPGKARGKPTNWMSPSSSRGVEEHSTSHSRLDLPWASRYGEESGMSHLSSGLKGMSKGKTKTAKSQPSLWSVAERSPALPAKTLPGLSGGHSSMLA
eukprot:CAMPEP_0197663002 /NCGR_PEP_ID=MMETSP1338-20131121/55729_1 /TAXON_ID=43686 ORGANISM="Pelagodinium beii, Strain RCC1491" /NCGR_SAMPLE_ID=MMETSP1338 /ASSEMBLY_ACC=CAM_ASM_000754 /LENGTH=310 /DNA_ID=CAMNT_0043241157 /DNA_START=56 /DNA_END=988 /DNA_ORIENTATION=+